MTVTKCGSVMVRGVVELIPGVYLPALFGAVVLGCHCRCYVRYVINTCRIPGAVVLGCSCSCCVRYVINACRIPGAVVLGCHCRCHMRYVINTCCIPNSVGVSL